jgi:molecular chaperone IbpA
MFGTGASSITYSVPETAKYLLEIQKNSIGLDEWFRRFDTAYESHTNYPPYNLIKESNVDFRLEIALAGYKREDIEVTTEWNKLFVEAKKSGNSDDEYLHQGLAKRAFTRTWTLSDDVEVKDVSYVDGLLTVKLNRVIPEHQKKKVYEIVSGVHERDNNNLLSDGPSTHSD